MKIHSNIRVSDLCLLTMNTFSLSQVEEAQKMDGSEVVSHSAITNFVVDKYDIV